jgi:magnesium chelatase subunit D
MTGAGAPSRWDDAALAATLFAIDPAGTVGVRLRAGAGPVRDRWLALLRALLPPSAPLRRVPVEIPDARLLGGLDLAATLRAGRPVFERGLLAELDGGVAVIVMAERLAPGTAARLAASLDTGAVAIERDGTSARLPSRFGVVALDEGAHEDETPPAALLDRLAFHVDLAAVGAREAVASPCDSGAVARARGRLAGVQTAPDVLDALCGAALALGIASLRAPVAALRVARACAALHGRTTVAEEDAAVAARLVLAPRATVVPAPAEGPAPDDPGPDQPETEAPHPDRDRPLEDLVVEAAAASLPPELLAQLRVGSAGRARPRTQGRAGALRTAATRGRPAGTRRGEPGAGARLNVVETLRAAAPWQPLRRRESGRTTARVVVRREDFRITRHKHRDQTTTIFVVDASGSAALHRLAEAKGAVELLLADCYVRRDRVALLAFRGKAVELLLPPTRSLVRAKRSLAGLPGGGGTPLAAAIDAATALADAVRRRGETPIVVLLTDGRANVARNGDPGRANAEADALAAARQARAAALTALVVDTSPRAQPEAQRLAAEMSARYLALPYANATALSRAIQAAAT